MTTTEERGYDWRHGWVPLTMRAALQKTKGDRAAAERLLEERRARRRGRRTEFSTPHPRHAAELAERRRWAGLSDDELADAMGAPELEDEELDRIVRELERRDKAAAKAERARARRAERKDAEERRRSAEYDAATDAGEDPEEAFRRIYGVTEEQERRAEAERSFRDGGYTGKTFRELVRSAHADHVRQSYLRAEEVCRGHMLNAAGERAGVDPAALFSGPAARAKKYASPELLDYFRDHGRATLEDFTASALGGHAKFRTTGDEW